jgi:predicted dinucleotide-binding enzyme
VKIGILGSGRMGSTLGTLWLARRGYEVFFGSRDSDKAVTLARMAGKPCQGGDYAAAAAFGEVVVLAVPWHNALPVVASLQDELAGKVLIDLTNPVQRYGDGLAIDGNTSGAQLLQEALPATGVVKAFNAIPVAVLDNPRFGEHIVQVYYATDSEAARESARQLIAAIDFVPVSAGGLANARYLEALAYLWIMQLAAGRAHPQDSVINIINR